MKKLLICSLFAVAPTVAFTQVSSDTGKLWSTYFYVAKKINNSIVCKKDYTSANTRSDKPTSIVTSPAFDSLYKPILSNVFVGSSNLPQNSTSASFITDANKSSININYIWRPNNAFSHFYSGGVFSKGSNGILGIYSNGSWASETGLNIGYSWAFKKTIFYDADSCDKIRIRRISQLRKIIESYKNIIKQNPPRDTLKAKINLLEDSLKLSLDSSNYVISRIDSTKTRFEQFLLNDSLIIPQRINDTSFFYRKLGNDLANWEVLQNVRTGYQFFWIGPNFSISNNSINLIDSVPKEFKSLYGKKNQLKLLVGVNGNWIRSTKRTLWYARAVLNFSKGSYLDNSIYAKPKAVYNPSDKDIYIADENISTIGKYSALKANIWSFEPNVYISWLFAARKQVGLDVTFSANLAPSLPKEVTYQIYPSSFTALIGPIFRLITDESISKGTVGIQCGIVNSQFNTNVWESFSAKFKIGIPFNALIK
ncbi:hypothetical protein [Chitinophaga varians]|uniref:hypothetical protein n=1 Tax=Chitinophaga varians TaxID=2202339 RepID=UPI00165FD518|nr:hypothetical protein [Chitinophaga varians]MBC9910571.1 hypothetical protein [Chitinophaga varians]